MFEYLGLCLVKVLSLFLFIVFMNFVILISRQIVQSRSNPGGRLLDFHFSSLFITYITTLKLLSKKDTTTTLGDFIFSFFLTLFSIFPIVFVPFSLSIDVEGALSPPEFSHGLLFCFFGLLLFPLCRIILLFSEPNYLLHIDGGRKVREYFGLCLVYLLTYIILYEMFKTNDLKMISETLIFTDFLKLLPAGFVFLSIIVNEYRYQINKKLITQLGNCKKEGSSYLVSSILLAENGYLVSLVSVLVSIFGGGHPLYILQSGQGPLSIYVISICLFFIKVMVVMVVIDLLHGFFVKRENRSLLSFDIDLKIILLLFNLILVSMIGI